MVRSKKADNIGMESLSSEDELFNLWLLIQRLRRANLKARRRELMEFGISPQQAGVLHVVRALGNKAILTRISEIMLIEPHTVSGIVKRMEASGLLKRMRGNKKKNSIVVVLTEKGDALYWATARREAVHFVLSKLTAEERAQFWILSKKILNTSLEYVEKKTNEKKEQGKKNNKLE